MIEIPQFTDIQKRAIYIALASSIAIGSLFVTLSQGKASAPKPTVSLAPVAPAPTIAPTIVVDVAGKVRRPGFTHFLKVRVPSMRLKLLVTSSQEYR